MFSLAGEAKSQRARAAKMQKASKMNALKVCTNRRSANMEVVAEEAFTVHAEHMAWIAELEGDVHERKGKLYFSESRNKVADPRYFILSSD